MSFLALGFGVEGLHNFDVNSGSALLRMVSPVFEKLLAEGTKKIEVKAATAHEFDALLSS